MSYLVLARKYRPQTFEDVVKQDHVTQTLSHAIEAGRVAHAILFSGPRGTGKTTVARILAKAMNCEKGPTAHPCNVCRSCREITAGNASDVFEIDGASNNGVDQVRELRENLKYMPAHSRYKIYIIDEVHMLSIAAFNALLKTLEEPPPHVLFFFATTEPHKIPITILSRCQRHDMRRIETPDIVAQMKVICHSEARDVSVRSLELIAREAGGSMRDGLSLLDQILSSHSDPVDPETVLYLLGAVDQRLIEALAQGILARDAATMLATIDEAYSRGIDLKKLYTDLVTHFRHLMVIKLDSRLESLVAPVVEHLDAVKAQIAAVSEATLNQIFRLLYDRSIDVRMAPDPKIACETVMFQVLQIQPVLPMETLIEKLDRLREHMRSGPVASAEMPVAASLSRSEFPASAPDPPEAMAPGPGPSAPSKEAGPPASGALTAAHDDSQRWAERVHAMAREYPALAAILQRSHVRRPEPERIDVVIEGSAFAAKRARQPKHMEIIRALCRDLFGPNHRVEISAEDDSSEAEKK